MRKRRLWIGIFCCVLAGCTGCTDGARQEKTAGIVTEKNVSGIQKEEIQVTYEKGEEASGDVKMPPKTGDASEALKERLHTSGHWTEELDFEDGSRILADAEVLLPNAEKFPVYTVTNKSWEPEFVKKMGDALLGDKSKWYEMDSYLSTPKEKRNALSPAEPEWKTWSEPSANVLDCNQIVKTGNGDTFALWAREQEWKNHEFYIQDLYGKEDAVSKSRNYDWSFDLSAEKQKAVEEGCGLTKEEAVSYAEKCLQSFPVPGFHVAGTAYGVRKGSIGGDGISDTAYFLACERTIGDIPITFDFACGGAFDDETAENPLWWNNELLLLFVNDRGVTAAEAYNFYDIGEKTADDVTLLPFPEICDVFAAEKQAEAKLFDAVLTYKISKVRLGYFRIFDPGEGSLTGKLIPVWDFYGSWIQKAKNGNGSYESDSTYSTMCTINAMDGSVIRRSVGY